MICTCGSEHLDITDKGLRELMFLNHKMKAFSEGKRVTDQK